MEILAQLGIDGTLWVQLVLFMISYFFMSTFIFKPYLKNLEYRKKNTTGANEEASKLMATTEHLTLEYERKMKANNETVAQIFNQFKNEGKLEEQRLISAARTKAEQNLSAANNNIEKEIQSVRAQIEKTLPEMSKTAAGKLLGRDL